MSSNIEKLRKQIDKIDRDMAKLYKSRMDVVEKIRYEKIFENQGVLDENRELKVISQNDEILGPDLVPYYRDFIQGVLSTSKDYQGRNKTGLVFGNLENIRSYFKLNTKVLIVADKKLPEKYIEKIRMSMPYSFVLKISSGEKAKSFKNYEKILKTLIDNEFTKDDCLVSLGGGAISDVCGFAAATYKRGINLYLCPTTLLSMVDAAIGGKNSLDFLDIKNIVGTVYKAKGILIDLSLLDSLSDREFSSGMAEIIKIALTSDDKLYNQLKNIKSRNEVGIEIIKKAIELKENISSIDPWDNKIRKCLNFGHTIGHAIEATSEYTHGEAVALGMIPMVSESIREDLTDLLKNWNLPVTYTLGKKAIKKLSQDKKKTSSGISVVLVGKPGEYVIKNISEKELIEIAKKAGF